MSVETLISVEEYLSSSYDPDAEYVDGVLVDRNDPRLELARDEIFRGLK